MGGYILLRCKYHFSQNNIEYRIREFKHKDGLDVLLNTINKNLFQKKDSTITVHT